MEITEDAVTCRTGVHFNAFFDGVHRTYLQKDINVTRIVVSNASAANARRQPNQEYKLSSDRKLFIPQLRSDSL